MRIHSQWHNTNKERSIETVASVVALNCWKITQDKIATLRREHRHGAADQLSVALLTEYLFFQAHLVDRIAQPHVDPARRGLLITALLKHLTAYLQESYPASEVSSGFTERFNQRSSEYAEYHHTEEGPSYPLLRHFGTQIQQVVGDDPMDRWIIDQIMDQDGPVIYRQLQRFVISILTDSGELTTPQ